VKKEHNGRKSPRRLKPIVGCNASKRRRSISMLWRIGIYIYIYIYIYTHTHTHIHTHTHTHIHISDCLGIVYDLPLLPKDTGSETFLHRSGAVQSVDYIYHWGASLAVTGPIRDTGQNVLQFSFHTESSSSPTYFHIFFLIALLAEVFVRNIQFYNYMH